jgi:hypothetical protein
MRAHCLALLTVLGCEHIDSAAVPEVPRPPEPSVVEVQPAAAPIPKVEPVIEEKVAPRVIEPRKDGLPNPPTDEPEAYAAWFEALPRDTKRRINSVCRKQPLDYQYICGGIGHLHIPYPPWPRARIRGESGPPIYWENWEAMLSPAQQRYVKRHCRGGEEMPSSDLCGDNTPLVVAFDSEPIQFTAGHSFAFANTPVATDWPTARTPWIALDVNGNGVIDSGAELFGSNTRLGDHTAANGFVALAALDANHDRVIDALDPAFTKLQLWGSELRPLADVITSISLDARMEARCDARDNCEGERAAFMWRDGSGALRTGTVVDVYLPRR